MISLYVTTTEHESLHSLEMIIKELTEYYIASGDIEQRKEKTPWKPSNAAQRSWIDKWKREQDDCQVCSKKAKCTVTDRQSKAICKLLDERIQSF